MVDAGAWFNRVAGDAQTDSDFLVILRAFSGTPGAETLLADSADAFRLVSDADPATWEQLTAEMALPPGTEFLQVFLTAVENVSNDASLPEFDGHFADEASVSLRLPDAAVVEKNDLRVGGPHDAAAFLAFDLGETLADVGTPDDVEFAGLRIAYAHAAGVGDEPIAVAASLVLTDTGGAISPDETSTATTIPLGEFLLHGSEGVSENLDVSTAVRVAAASGWSHVVLRLDAPAEASFRLAPAYSADAESPLGAAAPGEEQSTGLVIRTRGVVGDLVAGDGSLVARSQSHFDFRALGAGDYFLRVARPETANATDALAFAIVVDPPERSPTTVHAESQRDELFGGAGDDTLIGAGEIERLFGGGGRDLFVAGPLEPRDASGDDRVVPAGAAADSVAADPAAFDLAAGVAAWASLASDDEADRD